MPRPGAARLGPSWPICSHACPEMTVVGEPKLLQIITNNTRIISNNTRIISNNTRIISNNTRISSNNTRTITLIIIIRVLLVIIPMFF